MNKLVVLITVAGTMLFSCSAIKNNEVKCEPMMCTQEFRMVQVKFKDSAGNPVTVKDFAAKIKRTNESTAQNDDPSTINNQGIYTVASDADVRKLAESGEAIAVTATHPTTGKKVSADFVIAGGLCACHINKVSGPAEIIF